MRLAEVSGINDPKRFSFILSEKYSALAMGSDKFVATLACDIAGPGGGRKVKGKRGVAERPGQNYKPIYIS